jgi:hypothetical protein
VGKQRYTRKRFNFFKNLWGLRGGSFIFIGFLSSESRDFRRIRRSEVYEKRRTFVFGKLVCGGNCLTVRRSKNSILVFLVAGRKKYRCRYVFNLSNKFVFMLQSLSQSKYIPTYRAVPRRNRKLSNAVRV